MSPEEHIGQFCRVLKLLNDTSVTLRLIMCIFFTEIINYLDRFTHPSRLAISSHTADTFCELQPPRNASKLRLFLSLRNVFRRLVPRFSGVVAPLNQKLCKNQLSIFETLGDVEMFFLNTLHNALISSNVRALPISTGRMTLNANGCDFQEWCVLLQQQPDKTTKQIGCWSISLAPAERKNDGRKGNVWQ